MDLILCPISKEFKIVMHYMQSQGVEFSQVKAQGKLYKSKNFFLAQGGYGKVRYALAAQRFLMLKPEVRNVICFGCAGSLSDKVQPLDVVVGEKTIEYDFIEKFFPFHEGLPSYSADPQLLEKFSQVQPANFSVHVGSIASGDEDIVAKQRAHEIREKTGAIAVAWEGAGGALASKDYQRPFVEIRAITDYCDGNVSHDFTNNLKQAMENASDLLLKIY